MKESEGGISRLAEGNKPVLRALLRCSTSGQAAVLFLCKVCRADEKLRAADAV